MEYKLLNSTEVVVANSADFVHEHDLIIPERLGDDMLDREWTV